MNFALPPLYRPWMDEAFGRPILSEPRATCDNCVMCGSSERPAMHDYRFNPNTKCCAYHPSIPNYLVGAVLCDEDPSFAGAKKQFIQGAMAASVSPIGINPPYQTQLFYKIKPFGKFEQIRCPFYMHQLGGLCAIWKYRNARCSTWFCKHERGKTGLRFWNVLDEMLAFAEVKLAGWCIDEVKVIFPENSKDPREKMWGNWAYHEEEFFVSCWGKVRSLTWDQVMQIGGAELRSLVTNVNLAFEKLDMPLEREVLRKSNFTSEDIGDGTIRIWAYSVFNPLDVPAEIFAVLDLFDGRPIATVLAELENEKGIHLDPALLSQLIDYEVLV